jgi:quercetin dioxygenase-like cupin family protein
MMLQGSESVAGPRTGWFNRRSGQPPLQIHASYDETHIVCEGQYEARLGNQTLQLSAGDMFFAPRGTPHSIKCLGPETGRELMISSPGGVFDAFIVMPTIRLSKRLRVT